MSNIRFFISSTLVAVLFVSCATTYKYGAQYASENVTPDIVSTKLEGIAPGFDAWAKNFVK